MLLVPHFYPVFKEHNILRRSRKTGSQGGALKKTMLEELRGSAIEKQIKRQGAIAQSENRQMDALTNNALHDYCIKLIERLYNQQRYREALEIVCLACLQQTVNNSK